MIRQGILVFDDIPHESGSPAFRVAGLSLLERGIRTMARAGIRQLLVVVPQGTPVELSRFTQGLDIDLEFAHWGGSSPPTFAPSEAFLLLRGDHVRHHSSLTAFAQGGLRGCDFAVQTSRTTAPEQAARWVSDASGAVAFTRAGAPGKPASTGAFLCVPGLFDPGVLAAKTTDLWTFLADLFQGRCAAFSEIGPEQWQRVTDRRTARAAKNMLFSQVTKSTSGLVARTINVRISVPLSKVLIETSITPNMVTLFLVLSAGLLAAYLVMQPGDYARLFLAGILWQMASVLDGCDGEIARVKLGETKFGAWLDTITDNLSYVCGYAGMLVRMHRLHPDALFPLYAGLSAIAALLLTLAVMYAYALKTGTGSLQYYLGDLHRKVSDHEKDWSHRIIERFGFVAKRDFLSLLIAAALAADQFEAMFWFLVVLFHLAALGVLTTQYKLLGQQKPEPRILPPLIPGLLRSSLPGEEGR